VSTDPIFSFPGRGSLCCTNRYKVTFCCCLFVVFSCV